jgi:hypothetical protein
MAKKNDTPAPELAGEPEREAVLAAADAAADVAREEPLEFPLRLRRAAALGNGDRKRGVCLGSCERHPAVPLAELFASVVDSRWIREDVQPDGSVVIAYSKPRGERQPGDPVCRLVPADGATVRECVNAIRNPGLIGC